MILKGIITLGVKEKQNHVNYTECLVLVSVCASDFCPKSYWKNVLKQLGMEPVCDLDVITASPYA